MTLNSAPTRSYARLAIAIVVGAVVISATALSYSSFEATVTTTVTRTGASELYQVEFIQESNCPYGSWVFPWAVVINDQTIVQPSNATLPLSYNLLHLTGGSNYSTISFSLPNGTYNYAILPVDPLGSNQSGHITVDGSDIAVQVYAFIMAMGCSSSSS